MKTPKDKSILSLVARIQPERRGWVVLDDWHADLCAVGIATADRPRRLVHISTFNKGPGVFHFECESPTGESETDYVTTGRHENASFVELLQALESHLGAPDAKTGSANTEP